MFSEELEKKQKFPSMFFRKALEKSFLARSYLFCGEAIEAKKLLVKELNQILNCKKNQDKEEIKYSAACGECQNCRWIASDAHPATPILIEAEGELKSNIKIETIKESLETLSHSSDYFRIVLIEDASSKVLNTQSATTLLKVIEEAKSRTMFILLADQEDAVLSTIKSRSQVVNFSISNEKQYSEEAKEKYLEIKDYLLSSNYSALEQMLNAEKIAETKPEIIVEALSMIEDDLCKEEADTLSWSKKILAIENSIQALKAFSRPKSEIYSLTKRLAPL